MEYDTRLTNLNQAIVDISYICSTIPFKFFVKFDSICHVISSDPIINKRSVVKIKFPVLSEKFLLPRGHFIIALSIKDSLIIILA